MNVPPPLTPLHENAFLYAHLELVVVTGDGHSSAGEDEGRPHKHRETHSIGERQRLLRGAEQRPLRLRSFSGAFYCNRGEEAHTQSKRYYDFIATMSCLTVITGEQDPGKMMHPTCLTVIPGTGSGKDNAWYIPSSYHWNRIRER